MKFSVTVVPLLLVMASSAGEPATMPAPVAAMIQEHVGRWQTTGYILEGERRTPLEADWSCQTAPEGPGLICTWHHEWPGGRRDTHFELVGYDADTGKLCLSRLREDGSLRTTMVDTDGKSMTVSWEFEEGGRKGAGRNHIVVRESGHWEQRMTMEVEGKLVREMVLTQRRVGADAGKGS